MIVILCDKLQFSKFSFEEEQFWSIISFPFHIFIVFCHYCCWGGWLKLNKVISHELFITMNVYIMYME